MSLILPQTQTFSNTCDLINSAGSDSKVHVVDNERPTQAERGMTKRALFSPTARVD